MSRACSVVLAALLWLPVLHGASGQTVIDLNQGWGVLQDVHGTGEKAGLYRRDFNPYAVGAAFSPWEPISRLAHLQLLFAQQPYFGRELRYFNQAPWWYRVEFPTPADASHATLRFEGVDYFARVWLNEKPLGDHEGYADAFEFEVGPILRPDGANLLVVKVSSPWDADQSTPKTGERVFRVTRNLLKGTYEHADTFVQRDVNPVGIYRPVHLIVHDALRAAGDPVIETQIDDAAKNASVAVSWPVVLERGSREIEFSVVIRSSPDGAVVARQTQTSRLAQGEATLKAALSIPSPRLWSTWDRGRPSLYWADIRVGSTGLSRRVPFGVRMVELRRTPGETAFLINRKRIYLRGTTYWPDEYLSAMDRSRYERDLAAMVRAGIDAIRIHVHTENPAFYEICDRLGIAVIQDFDVNWDFPKDEAYTKRAVAGFERMIGQLRNHPSVICWIAMNEVGETAVKVRPGPQLVEAARRLDPSRPVIKNSSGQDDLESGDAHDYRGSLDGGHFLDIYGSTAKLATEFGIDAPPSAASARSVPRIAERLRDVLPRVEELHDYQYWVVKYYVEHYRIQKYAPNAGYFLFMWIDFCPQSFYGVYDYWGRPKSEGIGGGLRALEESNRPVGIFMEYKNAPAALHAVNDLPDGLGECTAEWLVTKEDGERVAAGERKFSLGPDSHVRISDLSFGPDPNLRYRVALVLRGPDGRELARNLYRDPFHPQAHPAGHPERMDHELGMRLWWAGEAAPSKPAVQGQ